MNYDGKVVICTALDNSGLQKGIRTVSGEFGGLKASLGKLAVAVAAAFSVRRIVQFGEACIELGSDVAEVQNVVETAFGSMADRVEQFAQNAITQFGMSSLAAKQTASNYMAMGKGMGIAQQGAADMALELAGLSGDVASFYNITQEEAASKLRGVYTGETEALKDLGVVMTQANLQQYALAHGMSSNISAMSQAQLVALRYAFVMDSLSLAQGDFVRTQDSWANQTRILSMQWQEFMSVIGQSLTTVLLPLVKALNTVVSSLIRMANAFNAAVQSIFGGAANQIAEAADANAAIGGAAMNAAEGENALADGIKSAAKAAKSSLASFDELNVMQSAETDSSGSSFSAIAGGSQRTFEVTSGTEIGSQLQNAIAMVQQLLAPLQEIDFIPAATEFGRLKEAVALLTRELFSGLEWAWYNLFVPLAEWTVEDVLPAFLELLAAACRVLSAALEALQPLGQWLWDNFLQPIAEWTGGVIVSVLLAITDALTRFSEWIAQNQGAVQVMATIFGSFAAAWMIVNAAVSIWNGVSAIATVVTTAFGAAVAFLTSPIGLAIIAVTALIAAGVLLYKNWGTVSTGIKNLWNGITEVVKGAVNSIIGFINAMISGICSGINTVIDALNSLKFDIPDWVPILGGKSIGFSLGTITAPQIPYLAQGAVIPPNREFLAVLGDQRSGTNIEAPEATLRKIMAEVLAEYGRSAPEQRDITVNLTAALDGEVIYRNQQKIKAGKGYPAGLNPAFA